MTIPAAGPLLSSLVPESAFTGSSAASPPLALPVLAILILGLLAVAFLSPPSG